MGKIICEVCGTVYPDSADCCPICGYSRDHGGFSHGDDMLAEDPEDLLQYDSVTESSGEGLEFNDYDLDAQEDGQDYVSAASDRESQGRKPIFDYDAVNPGEDRESYDSYQDVSSDVTLNDYPDESYENYDNYEEGAPKSHAGLIVFLVILILALIGASAFLLIKFVLPKLMEPALVPETTEVVMMTEAPTTAPTTVPTIPCQSLTLVEGGEVELTREGQFYLIHASVSPEDTTDDLSYRSEDENIVIVDQGGKITAVGEGTTNVVLTCGSQIIKLPITVSYHEETEAPEEASEETEGSAQESEAAQQENTDENSESSENGAGLKDVELKLKKTDLSSGMQGVSFRLELDCDLKPEDVEWSTTNSAVATVKDGVVTTVGGGICKIIAKYGSQEVTCLIRCSF